MLASQLDLTRDEILTIFAQIQYEPHAEQLEIHCDPALVKLVAGGERAGKSNWGAAELVKNVMRALRNIARGLPQRVLLYWIVGPDYKQTHAEFNYALTYFTRLGKSVVTDVNTPDKAAWTMELLNGAVRIETRSGEDPRKLASEAPDGVLMVEAAQQSAENFLKLFARMAEGLAKGEGWLCLVGTFEKGRAWYHEFFELFAAANEYGGKSFSLPTWSNLTVFPGGRNNPALQVMMRGLTHDYVQERFGGVPVPPLDLVFREFSHAKHAKPIEFRSNVDVPTLGMTERGPGWLLPKNLPVEIAIDPGYRGAYAVLFLCTFGGTVFHFDEIYQRGKTGEQVILELQARSDILERIVPERAGVMDIAGLQHHAMESQQELWRRMLGFTLRMERVEIVDGIQRHRTFLHDAFTNMPRLYHDPRTEDGTLWEYRNYRYPEAKENRDERELPIDANNHSMKALAYFLIARFGRVDVNRPRIRARPKTEVEKMIDSVLAKPKRTRSSWAA